MATEAQRAPSVRERPAALERPAPICNRPRYALEGLGHSLERLEILYRNNNGLLMDEVAGTPSSDPIQLKERAEEICMIFQLAGEKLAEARATLAAIIAVTPQDAL